MTDRPHYRRLYKTARWKQLRRQQLNSNPLCRMCLHDGYTKAAEVVDHVEPHKGDEAKFFGGKLQSLCKKHHDSAKQRQERRGYSTEAGYDGWPVDPKHPANTGRIT